MKPRSSACQPAAEAMKVLGALESYVQASGLEPSLVYLVKTRASQINGYSGCIRVHTREARAGRESEELVNRLDAWRESPLYDDRERAALAWTEAVTLVSETDALYDEARRHFSEAELVKLTVLVATINAWSRIATSFRWLRPVKRSASATV